MIKDLINKIATDSISLGQALTMAKVIASDIGNADFKRWVKYELEGYPPENRATLPSYRIIPCELVTNEYYLSSYHERPVDARDFDKLLQEKCGFSIYKIYTLQSVSTIENMVKGHHEGNISCNLPPFAVENLKRASYDGSDIYNIQQIAHVSQAHNILVQVKNRLLDTLLELKEQFPELNSDIFQDPNNKEKASTIINNNIYGGSPNINTVAGEYNTVTISNYDLAEQLYRQLLSIGVDKEDAKEAKEIVEKKSDPSFGKKLTGWISKMTNKAVEESIKYEVPKLLGLVSNLF